MSVLLLWVSTLLWGLVHSLLASAQVKAWFAGRLDGKIMQFYRLAYNMLSVVTFLPILWLMVILPDRRLYLIPWPWLSLTLALQAAAAILLVIGLFQTGWLDFTGLGALTGTPAPPDKLTTGGLYRWVRHPLYSAGLLFMWLTPVMTVNLLVVLIAATIYIIAGAYYEERKLLRQFGEAYARYQAVTPMFIPQWRNK